MSTEFDAERALREEIAGLQEIGSVLTARERRAHQQMSEAEAEYNALAKLRAFADAELARKRAVLGASPGSVV